MTGAKENDGNSQRNARGAVTALRALTNRDMELQYAMLKQSDVKIAHQKYIGISEREKKLWLNGKS